MTTEMRQQGIDPEHWMGKYRNKLYRYALIRLRSCLEQKWFCEKACQPPVRSEGFAVGRC
jgi:hypothetical protein